MFHLMCLACGVLTPLKMPHPLALSIKDIINKLK